MFGHVASPITDKVYDITVNLRTKTNLLQISELRTLNLAFKVEF